MWRGRSISFSRNTEPSPNAASRFAAAARVRFGHVARRCRRRACRARRRRPRPSASPDNPTSRAQRAASSAEPSARRAARHDRDAQRARQVARAHFVAEQRERRRRRADERDAPRPRSARAKRRSRTGSRSRGERSRSRSRCAIAISASMSRYARTGSGRRGEFARLRASNACAATARRPARERPPIRCPARPPPWRCGSAISPRFAINTRSNILTPLLPNRPASVSEHPRDVQPRRRSRRVAAADESGETSRPIPVRSKERRLTAMAQRMEDLEAITKVVQLYIDGAGGDVSKLRDAFHPDARMYGHIGPMQHAIPITGFFDMVAGVEDLARRAEVQGENRLDRRRRRCRRRRARRRRLFRLRFRRLLFGRAHRRRLEDRQQDVRAHRREAAGVMRAFRGSRHR